MKILVISDSHGRNDDVADVIKQVGHIDMLIHCGDVERGDEYIRSLVDCPVHMVSGNNDYDLELPAVDMFEIKGHRIMVTHGHRFSVYRNVSKLREYALKEGADIVMFGHTHRPFLETDEEITILNPGSLSYPRQPDRKPTYLIMEIEEDGRAIFEHEYYNSKFSELDLW